MKIAFKKIKSSMWINALLKLMESYSKTMMKTIQKTRGKDLSV